MKTKSLAAIVTVYSCFAFTCAFGFEGRITAMVTRGQTETWLYAAGTNQLRIERGETDRPYPKDILNLDTGAITLLLPYNRSFVRLPSGVENNASSAPMPPGSFPLGNNPQTPSAPAAAGNNDPTSVPGIPAMPPKPNVPPMPMTAGTPPMPMMMPPMEKMELAATGDTTNLLGYPCALYEIKQRGETMEIWATNKLMPFEPYLQNQPHHFGPRMIDEEWGGLLKAKGLFPLLAVEKFQNGAERLHFEVTAVQKEAVRNESLFQPPSDYQEIRPLPF